MASPKQPNLDSVTTINDDGSRYFLHPSDVRWPWNMTRRQVGVILIAIYILLPWIPINGSPAVFLDVENRMFHLFGLTLVPQDLWVMFFAISGLGFGLFFITSLLQGVCFLREAPERAIESDRRAEKWGLLFASNAAAASGPSSLTCRMLRALRSISGTFFTPRSRLLRL